MGGQGLDALIIRDASPADLGFMQRMLYEAANRPGIDWPPFEDCIEEPQNRRHWIGLMTRAGDLGVIAELARTPVGAAWIRRMRDDELRPLDDPAVPVLAIGVESEYRGRGIGGRLMTALLGRARDAGTCATDLDTGSFNEAAVKLYHSHGFVDIGQRRWDPHAHRPRLRAAPRTTDAIVARAPNAHTERHQMSATRRASSALPRAQRQPERAIWAAGPSSVPGYGHGAELHSSL
jgi:ribosomal protein S18 acetylase RimI-like enzyme